MNNGYWQAVDGQARRLRDDILVGREARYPGPLPDDVRRRLEQLLAGDEAPISGDPADE